MVIKTIGVIGTNKPRMVVRTKHMIVGTKTKGCGNKHIVVRTKYMFVGTKLYGCKKNTLFVYENK
jgi:hypothetical protein